MWGGWRGEVEGGWRGEVRRGREGRGRRGARGAGSIQLGWQDQLEVSGRTWDLAGQVGSANRFDSASTLSSWTILTNPLGDTWTSLAYRLMAASGNVEAVR